MKALLRTCALLVLVSLSVQSVAQQWQLEMEGWQDVYPTTLQHQPYRVTGKSATHILKQGLESRASVHSEVNRLLASGRRLTTTFTDSSFQKAHLSAYRLVVGPSSHALEIEINGKALPVVTPGWSTYGISLSGLMRGKGDQIAVRMVGIQKGESVWMELPEVVVEECRIQSVSIAKDKHPHLQITISNPHGLMPKRAAVRFESTLSQAGEGGEIGMKRGSEIVLSYALDSIPLWHAGTGRFGTGSYTFEVELAGGTARFTGTIARSDLGVDGQNQLHTHGLSERLNAAVFKPHIGRDTTRFSTWDKSLSVLRQAGGNTVIWPSGQAPESLLQACEQLGVYVFEANSGHKRIREYACQVGNVSPDGTLTIGEQRITTGNASSGRGPWLFTGNASFEGNGLGGWYEHCKEATTEASNCGVLIPHWVWAPGMLIDAQGALKPLMREVRAAWSPFTFDSVEYEELFFHKRAFNQSTAGLQVICRWMCNGQTVAELPSQSLTWQGDQAVLNISDLYSADAYNAEEGTCDGTHRYVDVHLVDLNRKQLLPVPHELLHAQIVLIQPDVPEMIAVESLWEYQDDTYHLESGKYQYSISASNGLPTQILRSGTPLLMAPADLQFWRPGGEDIAGASAKDFWSKASNRMQVLYAEENGAELIFHMELMEGKGHVQIQYQVDANGHLWVDANAGVNGVDTCLPRFGMRWFFSPDYAAINWYGLGRGTAYSDRSQGAYWGRHTAQIERMHIPYSNHDESGHRLKAFDLQIGHGANACAFSSTGDPFGFSAQPFAVEQLQDHRFDFQAPAAFTVLVIDGYMAPLGTCGSTAPINQSYNVSFVLDPGQ